MGAVGPGSWKLTTLPELPGPPCPLPLLCCPTKLPQKAALQLNSREPARETTEGTPLGQPAGCPAVRAAALISDQRSCWLAFCPLRLSPLKSPCFLRCAPTPLSLAAPLRGVMGALAMPTSGPSP
jgi:hypothetical protein